MKIYLVGGAVRDALLKQATSDRDWLVVGAAPDEMVKLGFKAVGKSFPVFLHPDSGEEYALARTERKQGHGYGGFVFHADKTVTLEQDLLRRDLTINAIAKDEEGNLIDPYNGRQDIEQRILRHVSPAFSEDPLRVLRVARFAAQFYSHGFKIADKTLSLIKQISLSGELEYLKAERVWQETERALETTDPCIYFQVLSNCQAFNVLFTELVEGWNSNKVSMLLALEQSVNNDLSIGERLCCFCLPGFLPQVDLDYAAGLNLAKHFCQRLRVPSASKEMLLCLLRLANLWRTLSFDAKSVLTFLELADPFRREKRFKQLLNCLSTLEKTAYFKCDKNRSDLNKRQWILDAIKACEQVSVASLLAKGHKGQNLGKAIQVERLRYISAAFNL